MVLLFAYLFLALFVSFLCSIMEAVLLSTPQSFLMVSKEAGHRWADSFIKMKNDIDKPLSAILSLNTVAHTVGAAGVGAQAIKVFGEASFGIVSAVLTILILVLTEIIPKTIGARYWRNLSKFSYQTIRIMVWITYPLVQMSAIITNLIAGQQNEQRTSREEIAAMASMGADDGVFNEKEGKIIQHILSLKNVKVSDIMTPRVVVVTANEEMTLADFMENKNNLNFSRIPVFKDHEENITGYVFRQTMLEKLAEDNHALLLKDIRRNILIVPDSMSLFSIWEKMLSSREHLALVVDEYGGMDGIITMEDIIETLLGLEIVDEKDTITDMQAYAKEQYSMRRKK